MDANELAAFVRQWCDREDVTETVREYMLALAAEDVEYWAAVSCWRLWNRAIELIETEARRSARRSF